MTHDTEQDEAMFARMELSMTLARTDTPKQFCNATTRSGITGYVVLSCSMHAGHVDQDGQPNEHVDVHAGGRWTA